MSRMTDPVLVVGVQWHSWAPEGKELFYRAPGDGFMSVEIETEPEFKPAKPKRLFVHGTGANNLMSYDVAPFLLPSFLERFSQLHPRVE